MAKLQAVYYRPPDGSEPVNQFIDRLRVKRQVVLDNQIERSRNLIVLLHIFRKDTGNVPESEIAIAKERWRDFRARMDAPTRRRPRPAGHDAP